MRLLRSSFLLLLFLLPAHEMTAQQDSSAPLIRPRYAGFWLSAGNTFQSWPLFYSRNVQLYELGPAVMHAWSGPVIEGGAFVTQPFAAKWDAELGIGIRCQREKLEVANVTALDSDGVAAAYTTEFKYTGNSVFTINARVSRELFRANRVALYAGVGGWAILGAPWLMPSYCGADAGLDLYFNVSPKWVIRLRGAAGKSFHYGAYFSTGIAFCHQGSKDMTKHPKHYYIRTYEEEE